jgi:hypothetical protein
MSVNEVTNRVSAIRIARVRSIGGKNPEYKLPLAVAREVLAIGKLGYRYSQGFMRVLETNNYLRGLFTSGLLLKEIRSHELHEMFRVDQLNRGLRHKDQFIVENEQKVFALKAEAC